MVTKFNDLYKKLNSAQKEAVDTTEGPVMVVAGPGTGKTQVLTLRIANILQKTDTAPENILALTFTDAAGQNMRRRLTEIIGPLAYRVAIKTFHTFCNDIIKNYPEEFPRIIGSRQITEIDQIAAIEELVDVLSLEILRPFGDRFLYIRDILSSINELKREGVTPEEFEKVVTKEKKNFGEIPDLYYERGAYQGKMKGEYQKLEKQIKKNTELAIIYTAYEEALIKKKIYDYSDMIMEVLKTLQVNENLLLLLQEEYQYILVDEYQDTNNAQNKIVELLMSYHKNPNIFVVGDEKQAIFRFQGASLENFLYFKNLYPEAKLITLTENYRSTQTILDSVHSLISSTLHANVDFPEKPLHLVSFNSPDVENYFLAEDIKLKIDSGVKPEEIAVLYRDNHDAFSIARLLEKFGVPYQIESDQDLFSDSDVSKIITLLRVANNYGQDEDLAAALHLDFLNIPLLEVYKLIRQSHDERISLYDLIERTPLAQKFSHWARLAKNENLLKVFETVFEESGLLRAMMEKGNIIERFEAINAFWSELQGLTESNPKARLADLFKYLETIEKHKLFIRKRKISPRSGRVRLMTVHRAKGLEFDHVYIAGAYDGHFGGRRSLDRLPLLSAVYQLTAKEKKDEGGDERRLFYVALSRARKGVTITYVNTSETGREQLPSQFVGEIKKDLIEELDTAKFEKDFEEKKHILFSATLKKSETIKNGADREFVREIFERQGLSVTALNNYLTCPWNYFYSNLLRLPKAQNKHMMYGTAVHRALRDFFSQLKNRDLPKENLLESFEFYLNKEPLNERDFMEVLTKGRKSLSGYYDKYYKIWARNVLTEFEIRGQIIAPQDGGSVPTVHLTGKLDKIEFIGNSNQVNVVDYKTGQSKSRNEIEGRTKDSNGNYKRQLVFYKLLLDNLDNKKYDMISGELDFIEPLGSAQGKPEYKKEKFVIEEGEVVTLKETITQVVDEILNLKFWDKTCKQKDCPYCALRNLLAE